ncbi:MAG: hypothetical protein AAF191_00145 [Verrucomicrobiota bacterium]
MGLRKKGTRKLCHEGRDYRWVVSPGDMEGLGVVIERFEDPKQRVSIWVEHGNVISPGLVVRMIDVALREGWRPDESGRELFFRVSEPDIGENTPIHLHQRHGAAG